MKGAATGKAEAVTGAKAVAPRTVGQTIARGWQALDDHRGGRLTVRALDSHLRVVELTLRAFELCVRFEVDPTDPFDWEGAA